MKLDAIVLYHNCKSYSSHIVRPVQRLNRHWITSCFRQMRRQRLRQSVDNQIPKGTQLLNAHTTTNNEEQQHTVRKESSAFSWTPCAVVPCTLQITTFINPATFRADSKRAVQQNQFITLSSDFKDPNDVGAFLSPTSSGLHIFARSVKSKIKTATNHTTTCNGLSANSTNSYPDETRQACNDQLEQAATRPDQTVARNRIF